jgi:peptidylprolyl isomerase/FKBP-type peptidyl-prolyl cis-trans isomerase FklB
MIRRLMLGVAPLLAALAAGAAAAEPPSPQRAFLEANARAPGVQTAPAIRYRVIRSGPQNGAHPTRTAAIAVRYEGRYIDGEIFDPWQDKPLVLRLKWLIPGFQQAAMMMKPGDEWEVYVPPELAYGWAGAPPSGRTLIFKLQLVDWAEAPPGPSPVLPELPAR